MQLLYSVGSEMQIGSLLVEYISIFLKLSKMLFSLGLDSSLSLKVVFFFIFVFSSSLWYKQMRLGSKNK